MGNYCYECRRYNPRQDVYCKIIPLTMFLEVDHPDYPTEWIYQGNVPICTKFSDKRLKLVKKPRVDRSQNQLF
jgi:hypothetical protein